MDTLSQTDDRESAGPADVVERARELAKAGDLDEARALLTKLVATGEAQAPAYVLYGQVLFRRRLTEDALRVARLGVERFPANWRMKALLANMLQGLRRTKDAEAVLRDAIDELPENAPLHALHAETRLIMGDCSGALKSIELAEATGSDDRRLSIVKVIVVDALGHHDEAASLLEARPELGADLPANYRRAISEATSRRDAGQAILLAESAGRLMPDNVLLKLDLVERLLVAQWYDDARIILERGATPNDMPHEIRVRFHKLRARLLQGLRDRKGATEEFERALAIAPEDEEALRGLYVLHQQSGQAQEMRAHGRRLASAGARKMPSSLAEGLDQLRAQKSSSWVDPAKLDWAWELADKRAWNKKEWLEGVEWGHEAAKLMKDWWLYLPDRATEIDALIDRPTHNALEGIPSDAKCICVTSHMGPVAAGVRFLQTCGRPFRGFGTAGPDAVVGDGPPMRIAADRGISGLRELIREIRNCTIIGFAVDLPAESPPFEFCGRKISISTLVPRLIFKEKAKSIWLHALWRDGRIVMELDRMPDPQPGEDIQSWCRRWIGAYLVGMTRVMRGAPENLTLRTGGIWQNAVQRQVPARP